MDIPPPLNPPPPARQPEGTVPWRVPTDSEHQTIASADRAFRAWLARLTFGISPTTVTVTRIEWLANLLVSPGKLTRLAEQATESFARFGLYAVQSCLDPRTPEPITPPPGDRRFASEGWRTWPYNLFAQSFLLTEAWWEQVTTGIEGVTLKFST